jgi:hypothetical protein
MKTRNTTDCALGQRGLRVACAHNCGRDVCTRNNLKQQCTNTAHCVHTYDNPRLQSRKRCLVPSPDVSLSLRLHPRCPCSQSAPDPFPPELRPTSAPPHASTCTANTSNYTQNYAASSLECMGSGSCLSLAPRRGVCLKPAVNLVLHRTCMLRAL